MQRKTPRWHHLNFDVNTSRPPAGGATDADAVLRAILGYRPNPLAAYFGVYGIVAKPGMVRVGDAVEVV